MARILTALAHSRREAQDPLAASPVLDEICRNRGHLFRDRVFSPLIVTVRRTALIICSKRLAASTDRA
jgi:hypothetical protein